MGIKVFLFEGKVITFEVVTSFEIRNGIVLIEGTENGMFVRVLENLKWIHCIVGGGENVR